jgi:hypothetical protein
MLPELHLIIVINELLYDLNGFRNIRALPVSGGMGPPHMVMTYILSDVPIHKNQGYVWFKGRDLNGFRDIRALPV